MENIPDIILTAIEQQSFDTLNETTQELVLQHMSREAYETLHQTAIKLQQNKPDFPEVAAHQKSRLMDHFMEHNHRAPTLWRTQVHLWKVASIILLLGGGWLLHWQSYQQKKVEYVTQLDTVYLEKEVPVKVYDTVYYKEESTVSYTSESEHQEIPSSAKMNRTAKEPRNPHAETQRRGVSAKDDSLIQSFKFVTL